MYKQKLNDIIRPAGAKIKMFEKVFKVHTLIFFLVIYFMGEVMGITDAKFQAKLISNVESRAL